MRRPGVTLTEVVISIPLVGLVLAGAMTSTGAVLRTWNSTQDYYAAEFLAESLLAEIMQQPYEEEGSTSIGTESGDGNGNRKKWDDVDDYHGWSSSPPKDKENATIENRDGWSRAVTVVYAQLADPTQTSGTDTGLKRITVSVTDPAGGTTTRTAFRSRWGMLQQPPAIDSTLQTYISHELKLQPDSFGNQVILHNGTSVPNYAE